MDIFRYYITSRKYGPRISIANKYENKRQFTTPGPGEYDMVNLTTKEISYTMGYKYDEKKKDESPSSFSYNKHEKKHCIGGKIGKSNKFSAKNESPGPGDYNI